MYQFLKEDKSLYASFVYTRSSTDGYLVNVHGDFAELIKVNLSKSTSEHIFISAPREKIQEIVAKKLVAEQGYKLCKYVDLSLQPLAA